MKTEEERMIYHITTRGEWQNAQATGHYSAPSLEKEGFIHCSKLNQVLGVANAFYRDLRDVVLLCIDESKLSAALKWEAPAHPEIVDDAPDYPEFPHVYGTINLDAVLKVVELPQGENGYHLPNLA
jgi:uncharacterized protein (DUF952 family)